MKKSLLLFFIIITSSFGNLSTYNQYDRIFKKYQKQFNISYFLVKSIALTENARFDTKAIRKNTNGTIDVGLMQINSNWIKWMPEANITIKKLKNPDFNIKVAFMILDRIIKRHGYSWHSIGRYHSGTPSLKRKWLKRIKKNIEYLASIDERVIIVKKN